MAQGLSNTAICPTLVLAPASVEKHITNIFAKLDLPPADDAPTVARACLRTLTADRPVPAGRCRLRAAERVARAAREGSAAVVVWLPPGTSPTR